MDWNLDATLSLCASPTPTRLTFVIGASGRPMWKLMVLLQDVRVAALLSRASTTDTLRSVVFACKNSSVLLMRVETALTEQRQGPEVPHSLRQVSGKEEEK